MGGADLPGADLPGAAPAVGPVPVLLVHGIRTSATMWRHQLEWLAAANHPVLAIDLPGHGARLGEQFTAAAALAAIDAGVDAVGGTALLVGLSLGGYWTIAYAARHPEKVLGLVAAGSSFVPSGPGLAVYRLLARQIRRLPDRGLALHTFLVRRMLREPGVSDVLAGGVALDVMDAGLGATGALAPLADLRSYPGRVWLVNGAWDHFRLHQNRFRAAASRGTVITVPGAGHLVSLHRPHAFDRILRSIIAEVEADLRRDHPDSVHGQPG